MDYFLLDTAITPLNPTTLYGYYWITTMTVVLSICSPIGKVLLLLVAKSFGFKTRLGRTLGFKLLGRIFFW